MRLEDIAHATAFLTRLPVPGRAFGTSGLDFSRQCWAFPLVALPVGAIGWLAAIAFGALTGNGIAAGIAGASAMILATGALHEDGLADCADGFWGASSAARRLKIMRDSTVGTYGVLALVSVFAMRVAVLGAIIDVTTTAVVLLAIVSAVAVGRVALVWQWVALAPAPRDEGGAKGESLATRFGVPATDQAILASAFAAAILLVGFALLPDPRWLVATGLAALATIAISLVARAKIGGHTGDTLGAASLLAETAFLCGWLAPMSAP